MEKSGGTHYPPGCLDCHWKMSLGWPSEGKSRKVPGYLGVLEMGTRAFQVSLPSPGGGSIGGLQAVVDSAPTCYSHTCPSCPERSASTDERTDTKSSSSPEAPLRKKITFSLFSELCPLSLDLHRQALQCGVSCHGLHCLTSLLSLVQN